MPTDHRCGKRNASAQASRVRLLVVPPLVGVLVLVVLAFGPPTIDVGKTVLLAPRTKTSGCTLAANPDRRCGESSPNADDGSATNVTAASAVPGR